MIEFELLHPQMTEDMLGFIPYWLDPNNSEGAAAQIHRHYGHGGGWDPFAGFTLGEDNSLIYPQDPPMKPLAQARLREELILFYPHSWVVVVQPDRSFEASRID